MTKPDKPYMLLRPLPLYERCTIHSKRFWMNQLGLGDDHQFDKLVEKGWFK